MEPSIVEIKAKMLEIIKTLDDTLLSAAAEISALNTPNCSEYKDAILCQNGFGTDTAEIYFYRSAPQQYPLPSEPGFNDIQEDASKKAEYDLACYESWKNEIDKVKAIVEKYRGEMTLECCSLERYIESYESANAIPNHRVHVRITMPNQILLKSLRTAVKNVLNYEV